jgi:hypothetical protein
MEVKVKVRFMGEIVTPRHPCSTWNERKGYLQRLSWRLYFFLLDEFRPVGIAVAARQPSRDPFSGRGENCKTAICKIYPKTTKTADPRYKGVMGVMEQETGLT